MARDPYNIFQIFTEILIKELTKRSKRFPFLLFLRQISRFSATLKICWNLLTHRKWNIVTKKIAKHVCIYPTEGTRQKLKFSPVSRKKLKCVISHITLVFCFLVSKSSDLRFAKNHFKHLAVVSEYEISFFSFFSVPGIYISYVHTFISLIWFYKKEKLLRKNILSWTISILYYNSFCEMFLLLLFNRWIITAWLKLRLQLKFVIFSSRKPR